MKQDAYYVNSLQVDEHFQRRVLDKCGKDFAEKLPRLHPYIGDVVDDTSWQGALCLENTEVAELEALTSAARKLDLFPGFSPVLKENIRTPWQLLRLTSSGLEVRAWTSKLDELRREFHLPPMARVHAWIQASIELQYRVLVLNFNTEY